MKTIGLISGCGELPKAIASGAKAKGFRVVAVGLEPFADRSLSDFVDEIQWVNIGKFSEIINSLKKAGVKEAVMAGKIPKDLIFKNRVMPDLRAMKFLFKLKDSSDESVLRAITAELSNDGITILSSTDFCADILTPEKVLTQNSPTDEEWKDIRFGWNIAKEIGRLDIGQTVVVKNLSVMAVEAIEGTDEAIKRGGSYASSGAVVVKVSKPDQDLRFDVPVVGIDTLKAMIEANARVLALEAGKSILLQKDEFITAADKAGISVLGYRNNVD